MESLQHQRQYRKLCYFYKIYNEKSSDYLSQLIPTKNHHTPLETLIIFYSSTIIEWKDFAPDLRNSDSYSTFKKIFLNFIRPSPNSIFNCHNPEALRFITRLRLGLSHLRYHKSKNNFQDSLNPLCNRGLNTESNSNYHLHCPLFADERKTFLSNIKSINHKFLE